MAEFARSIDSSRLVWNQCIVLSKALGCIYKRTIYVVRLRSLRYGYTDYPRGSEYPYIVHNMSFTNLKLDHVHAMSLSVDSDVAELLVLNSSVAEQSVLQYSYICSEL